VLLCALCLRDAENPVLDICPFCWEVLKQPANLLELQRVINDPKISKYPILRRRAGLDVTKKEEKLE
jgi:hypothetical protein